MLKRGFILCLVISLFLIGAVYAEESEISTESGISLINFFPTEAKVGDVQFNIQIKNGGNETMNNLIAFVSGRGYSSYDIIPVDSLAPGEKSYILVYGNLKESGNETLTLRIDREIFYKNITVENPDEEVITDFERERVELENVSQQIEELKGKYASLELEISDKKDNGYDVSKISLDDLKKYLRNAEASVLDGNLKNANSNLKLAMEEYEYQKSKLDAAKAIPTINKIKDYAIIFSAIAGSILAFFAVYELLIKKSITLAKAGKDVATKVIKRKKTEE